EKTSRQDIVMKPARKTLRRPDELVAAGLIAHERRGVIEAVAARYALALTADVAELIDPADPRDPIARQFVPAAAELDARPEEMADPIGDDAHSPVEGIVHRYPDRVLLKPVHVCAAYCRFCFRRDVVARACARLVDAGIPMLSQTVLLRGVNDEAAVLGELMRALVECRIKPYYLHHGDLAPGTAQWRTGIEEGQALMRALHGRLSGLCQPTYVLDIAGGYGKSPVGPVYVARVAGENGAARYEVEDFRGRHHTYPPGPATSVSVSPRLPVDGAAQ